MFAHLRAKGQILLDFLRDEEVEDAQAHVISEEALSYLIECFGTPVDIATPLGITRLLLSVKPQSHRAADL